VLPGPKLPRVAGTRVLYRDGTPVATLVAGEVALLVPMAPEERQSAAHALTLDAGVRWLAGRAVMSGRPA